MTHRTIIGKFLIWRVKHIEDRYFIIFLGAIIGVLAGIAAGVLKTTVLFISRLLTSNFPNDDQNYWFLLFPLIGVLLTIIFIKWVIRDNVKHGIPQILYVISRKNSQMKRHKSFSSLIGASLTAGFGGSIGLESPIISTGSSLGSSIGQLLRLNYRTKTLLIGCGAAGAMASIFNTPIAAVIFGLEVLMLDLATSSIVPLLIASVAGSITSKLLFSDSILFNFELKDIIVVSDYPFFLLLGIFTGFVSLYFSKMNFWVTKRLAVVKNDYFRAMIGMLILGIMIFLFPPLYGEGYAAIETVFSGKYSELMNESLFFNFRENEWILFVFILFVLLLKVIAASLTIESGGIGGIFAPSAVMGGLSGFIFARGLNDLGISKTLSESNFTLVGMAGVLGGVLHAPLTAIFLIAEMTNGYNLIVPLMLTTVISFITIKVFDPHSIFTKTLAERGDLITHHKDQTVLTLMSVKNVIDKDLSTIRPGMTLGDLTKVIAKSKRNIYPVVKEDMTYLGLVVMDDVREDMFKPELYDTPIEKYIMQPIEKTSTKESMEVVMEKFNKTGYYNLPVIDDGKYVGFVSRANIFKNYRKLLIDVSHE
jgi:CIC family chloride channel protein